MLTTESEVIIVNAYKYLVAGIMAVFCAVSASADTISFFTPVGSTQSGDPVSAEADFTTSANTLTITLKNLLTAAQVDTVAQNLSDLMFTISGTFAGIVNDTDRTYTGTLVDVAGGGAVSIDAGNGLPASYNGWDFSNSGTTFLLEDLGSAAGPGQTIIGGAGATSYPNAVGSIAGNGPHNPFLQGDAVFTLTIPGITADTQITSATFSFGTTTGNNIPGTTATPEPKTTAVLLLVGTAMALVFRRKRIVAE